MTKAYSDLRQSIIVAVVAAAAVVIEEEKLIPIGQDPP
jgi:hypothetical protein